MDINSSNNFFNKNSFEKIKSKYILKQIFDNLKTNKLLRVIHYNKILKNILNIKMEKLYKWTFKNNNRNNSK